MWARACFFRQAPCLTQNILKCFVCDVKPCSVTVDQLDSTTLLGFNDVVKIHSVTQPLSHSVTHSVTHSITHSLSHSLTHLLTHSLTQLLTHCTLVHFFPNEYTFNMAMRLYYQLNDVTACTSCLLVITVPCKGEPLSK